MLDLQGKMINYHQLWKFLNSIGDKIGLRSERKRDQYIFLGRIWDPWMWWNRERV